MELEAAYLLQQIKEDMAATSARQHRDARRQHTLHAASLALGTGLRATVVKTRLAQAGLVLRPMKQTITTLREART